MAMQALDTFVADLPSGPMTVEKGQVFPDVHPVVKLDEGRGILFAPFDLGEDDKPAAKATARRAAGKAAT